MTLERKTSLYYISPKFIREWINKRQAKRTILKYYSTLPLASVNSEEQVALDYLKDNKLCVFPYPFQHNYKRTSITVYKDNKLKLKYILQDGKRLYFKRKSSSRGIKRNYNYLLIEQDINSPHRYLTDTFNLSTNDILVDVGAAEGNLALSVIEKVKKIYLFETDENWIEALKATFSPWQDKVEIINKFVSHKNEDNHVSLDEFFKDKEAFSFLKVDAEGSENEVLQGSETLITAVPLLKIALCSYHKPNDEKDFKKHLAERGFTVSHSSGYMIFPERLTFYPPYLRRGILRAETSIAIS